MTVYVLIVLQTVAVYSTSTSQVWNVLGEFKTEKACIKASQQLVEAQKKSTASYTPSVYRCLPKDVE